MYVSHSHEHIGAHLEIPVALGQERKPASETKLHELRAEET